MDRFHRIVRALGWPARAVLIALIRAYQRFVSPLFAPSCRYAPCCSSYAITAIDRHGAAKGLLLTAARLVRCNPWTKGGIDRVPRRGEWRSPVDPDGTRRPRRSPGPRTRQPGRGTPRPAAPKLTPHG